MLHRWTLKLSSVPPYLAMFLPLLIHHHPPLLHHHLLALHSLNNQQKRNRKKKKEISYHKKRGLCTSKKCYLQILGRSLFIRTSWLDWSVCKCNKSEHFLWQKCSCLKYRVSLVRNSFFGLPALMCCICGLANLKHKFWQMVIILRWQAWRFFESVSNIYPG